MLWQRTMVSGDMTCNSMPLNQAPGARVLNVGSLASSCVCRDEPSSAQRQVAYDTMKLYQALHTQALQGELLHDGYRESCAILTSHGSFRPRQGDTSTEHPGIQPGDSFGLTSCMQPVSQHESCHGIVLCTMRLVRQRLIVSSVNKVFPPV